jgi:hypothetical protein
MTLLTINNFRDALSCQEKSKHAFIFLHLLLASAMNELHQPRVSALEAESGGNGLH